MSTDNRSSTTARLAVLVAAVASGLAVQGGGPARGQVQHPFILWTREDAAAIRQRIEKQPWAKRELERMFEKDPGPETRRSVDNLFRYMVLGDKGGVEVETGLLNDFIGAPPDIKDPFDWMWHHMDHYEMALRYDTLYAEIKPATRRALDATFRQLARWGIEEERLRGFEGYPRLASHTICALVTGDKRLIRGIFEMPGGLKDYFDSMVDGRFSRGAGTPSRGHIGHILLWCRGCERLGLDEIGFSYVGKSGATLRKFLEGIIASADPRIEIPGGRPFYGSALMRHTQPSGLPGVEAFPFAFCGTIIHGQLPGGGVSPHDPWHGGVGAKGYSPLETTGESMTLLSAFELAHRKWPDAGFDYFLAQMRRPGDERYVPSLYWGLEPIDPAKVKTPAMPSLAAPGRGQALLRAEEGPEYWTSPAPAAALEMGFGHGLQGAAFSLLGLTAFQRPLYFDERHLGAFGEGPTWAAAARSHCTVAVDNRHLAQVRSGWAVVTQAVWPKPPGRCPVRSDFNKLAKFVAVRGQPREVEVADPRTKATTKQLLEFYPGVKDTERCLLLTREYLFDVFRMVSSEPRTYHWLVHAFGKAVPDRPEEWKESKDLPAALASGDEAGIYNFRDERSLAADGRTWSLGAVQTCALEDLSSSRLGQAWYDRRIGVRVTMLGEPGTTAYFAPFPGTRGERPVKPRGEAVPQLGDEHRLKPRDKQYDTEDQNIRELDVPPAGAAPAKRDKPKPEKPPEEARPKLVFDPKRADEMGGVSIIAARRTPATAFVVLHEPMEKGQWKIDVLRRIGQTDQALAVAVVGRGDSPVNDRVLLKFGDGTDRPVTLAGDGESFTFADHACVRIAKDAVEAVGDLRAMNLKVEGRPKLVLNGKEQKAEIAGGTLSFGQ
ncbi:MAG: hypothetical protein ABR915_03020 [Thermoguttaceae bacterium]